MNLSFLTIFQLAASPLVKNDETIIAGESMESEQCLFKMICHIDVAQFNGCGSFNFHNPKILALHSIVIMICTIISVSADGERITIVTSKSFRTCRQCKMTSLSASFCLGFKLTALWILLSLNERELSSFEK